MKIKKALQLSLNMLFHSKLRSYLTIVGIVIGIAAVVSIISVSQGAQKNLESNLNSIGADILTVSPGFSRAQGAASGFGGGGGQFFIGERTTTTAEQKNLTSNDLNVIRGVSNVQAVMGTLSGRAPVNYLGQNTSVSIQGVDPQLWSQFTTTPLASGRYLTVSDINSVVVGYNVANSIFTGMVTNRQITINGQIFNIVGILQQSGSGDSSIIMPISSARTVLSDLGGVDFSSISVKITDVSLSNSTVNAITQSLLLSRGIIQANKQDFSVISPAAIQARVTSTLSSISLFLAAIAAISLIVGAVGIANTMFTSVLEKTKDIGIMKALGAQNKDILLIFLFNSGLLGLVGGIGGIILGVIGAGFIGSLSSGTLGRLSFGSVYFSPTLIIGAFLLSILVGMVAGVIPAYRASKLSPVAALRYE